MCSTTGSQHSVTNLCWDFKQSTCFPRSSILSRHPKYYTTKQGNKSLRHRFSVQVLEILRNTLPVQKRKTNNHLRALFTKVTAGITSLDERQTYYVWWIKLAPVIHSCSIFDEKINILINDNIQIGKNLVTLCNVNKTNRSFSNSKLRNDRGKKKNGEN